MATIQEAKQQIAQERARIEQTRERAEQARKEIIKEEKKLPKATQERLRSGLYTGIEGRKRRRAVSEAKEEVERRKRDIELFTKGLKEREKKVLTPFEQKIKQAERAQGAYATLRRSIEKSYEDGYGSGRYSRQAQEAFSRAGLDPNKAEKIYRDAIRELGKKTGALLSQLQRKQLKMQPEISEVSKSGYSVPTIFNPKTGELGAPLMTFEERAKQTGGFVSTSDPHVVHEINIPKGDISRSTKSISTQLPSSKINFSVPRNLSLTQTRRDFASLKSFDISQPSKEIKKISETNFRTTGSPMRITKATSLKSRGHLTKPISKIRDYAKKSKSAKEPKIELPKTPKSTKKKGKKGKDEDFLLGDGLIISKDSKKGKKKINLWGS